MNLKQIHLSLDPRAVARLALLAEEQQMTLAGLIAVVLDRHLDDVLHLKAQAEVKANIGVGIADARQQQAEEFSPLWAWLRMSPEARWDAAERGLVQPPWAELEAEPRPPMMQRPFDRDLQAHSIQPAGSRPRRRPQGAGPMGSARGQDETGEGQLTAPVT